MRRVGRAEASTIRDVLRGIANGHRQAAHSNTVENFSYVFRKALESLFIDHMD
jgi:hypothetical protein